MNDLPHPACLPLPGHRTNSVVFRCQAIGLQQAFLLLPACISRSGQWPEVFFPIPYRRPDILPSHIGTNGTSIHNRNAGTDVKSPENQRAESPLPANSPAMKNDRSSPPSFLIKYTGCGEKIRKSPFLGQIKATRYR